ncbi:CBS domain-containing protein [Aliivibrio finisterrensis]|uniref:CBS domain-containing protein n=1 Tax=Aliivibrio finisterrensis TaxID=511998 RepID=A0A4Q5KM99_9GAMM|nr:DUF294 nucleotidyltransferase-like domain-containing protein [Aliivibrio finisterrensis]RYU47549.1 CBS domain-containing protein [Aliivibrio finisterrensis]
MQQDPLIQNIIDFISRIDPFTRLPKTMVERISSKIRIIYLGENEHLDSSTQEHQQYLYLIRTGAIEQIHQDGSLRSRLGEEDVFGFSLLKNTQDYQIKAIESSLLYLIPISVIHEIQQSHPEYTHLFDTETEVRINSAINALWSNNDTNHFFNSIQDVSTSHTLEVDKETSIYEVAQHMRLNKVSCAIVTDKERLVGIVTNADMTERVIANALNIYQPIHHIMTVNPITICASSLIYQAIITMMQSNIKHLPVMDSHKVIALVTLPLLLQNNRLQAIFFIDKIKSALNEEELAQYAPQRQIIFNQLVKEKVPAVVISQIMTIIMDTYNQRLIDIAIERLGPPPCDYAWMVAGSHARNEVHISSDQDSALILSDEATSQDRLYFQHLAMIVTKGMDSSGYSLCPGKFMAVTAKWCQPLSTWKAYYKKWISNPEYAFLLNLSVFLDTRTIAGNASFLRSIQDEIQDRTANAYLLTTLFTDSLQHRTPLGIFNNLILVKNNNNEKTLNIKRHGINIIVDLARLYSLAAKTSEPNTRERLLIANQQGFISDASLKNILSAYDFLCNFRFSYQADTLARGQQPEHHINPNYFGSFERQHIKDAFRLIDDWQKVTKINLGLLV